MNDTTTTNQEDSMHTPTPWNAVKPINAKHSWDWAIAGQNGDIAMKLEYLPPVYHPDGLDGWRKEAEDNASLIVRAVNSYAALREAHADIHDILSDILEDPDVVLTTQRYTALCAIQKSRNALALADGKEQP